jgi:hypothetical protein
LVSAVLHFVINFQGLDNGTVINLNAGTKLLNKGKQKIHLERYKTTLQTIIIKKKPK